MDRRTIAYISLAASTGFVFSPMLMRLGIDIESPEILRYILIGTIPLTVVLLLILLRLRLQSTRHMFLAGFVLSGIMCVPLESLAYVSSNWGLRSIEVFRWGHLPMLLLLLLAWATVIGLMGSLIVFVLARVIR